MPNSRINLLSAFGSLALASAPVQDHDAIPTDPNCKIVLEINDKIDKILKSDDKPQDKKHEVTRFYHQGRDVDTEYVRVYFEETSVIVLKNMDGDVLRVDVSSKDPIKGSEETRVFTTGFMTAQSIRDGSDTLNGTRYEKKAADTYFSGSGLFIPGTCKKEVDELIPKADIVFSKWKS